MASRMGEHGRLRAVGTPSDSRTLFSVKLRPPGTATGTVSRARLHEALDRGLEAGTVVVCAPAGSGKSTLLAHWSRDRRPTRHVAWVTLGTSQRDPSRFLEYALAAIDAAMEGTTDTEGPGGPLSNLPPVPATVDEDYLTVIAQRLSNLNGEVTVVLDDFHHVIGSATERLLRRLLRHPVEQLRVVVLSRRTPALGQTKLRLRGQLVELGPADLALTVNEIADLLRTRMPDGDSQESADAVHRHTGGWPAGVTEVIDAADDLSDPQAVEQALRRATPVVADYLDAEVLHGQPAEIVSFLRGIATVDDVCGELADALTGREGGVRTLADLHRDRLFLEPDGPMSDERCTWYRWNPLVASVLRRAVREEDPSLAAQLHAAAARWFRSHGVPDKAVRHAIAADDVDGAATVLATSWFSLATTGDPGTLPSLLGLFDETRLAADPELVVITAFAALIDYDLPRASLLACEAQDAASALPTCRRFAIDVASVAVRLGCAGLTGRPDTADLYASALALLARMEDEHRAVARPERRRRALLLHAVGTFEMSQWQYDEAGGHLRDALSEAASLGMQHDLLPRARAQLAGVEILAGRLDLARSDALDVIDEAHHDDRAGSQAHAAAHLVNALVELHRGDPETALGSLAQARRALHPADRVGDARVRLARHAALLLGNRPEAAEDELDDLREELSTWDAPAWVGVGAAVAEADQLRALGRADRSVRVLEAVAASATRPRAHQVWRTAYAEALLDAARPDEARGIVEEITAGSSDRPLEVQALLVHCLAADALGLPEESLHSLTRALRLSSREHILRPFLLRRAELRPVLESMLAAGTGYEGYVRQILARLSISDPVGDYGQPLESLTTRELEVLRALRGSATNEQIAAQLFISLNTLRSHIKLINRKLGTTSRREAVAQGRRMGLV